MAETKKPVWLVVGGDTLAGREIRELVENRKLPVTLVAASSKKAEHVLRAADDEMEVIEPLTEELVRTARVVLLAAGAEGNEKALAMGRGLKPRPVFVDVLAQYEDLPESVLCAPVFETPEVAEPEVAIHTLAHPAALALARLLEALNGLGKVRAAVVTVFEPASERGQAGVEELHQQAMKLFNFQPLPKEVYDAQVCFNVLPALGTEAPLQLEQVELRLERHLTTLLGKKALPLPSVRLVQAPVFHGYMQSVWVEFEARPLATEVEAGLEAAGIEVFKAGTEPLTNSAVAGQSGLAVSNIREDRSNGRAMWLWLGTDNLFTLAENALLTAALASKGSAR